MKASRRDFIQSLGLGSASLSLGHYNSYSKDSKSISLDSVEGVLTLEYTCLTSVLILFLNSLLVIMILICLLPF
jgi:hypothetical protein